MKNTLKLKQRLIMRDHQEPIVSDIISHFGGKPYVLGSSPSSGKTEMAIETIIRLMESGKIKNVLILAHSTNVLKMNFYERLLNYFYEDDGMIDVMTTHNGNKKRNYNYDAPIQVMIPQNIAHIKGKFDLIVVDEAHHNVLADGGNYTKIVEKVKPKYEVFLTGTPSKFIRENDQSLSDDEEERYYINCVGMDVIGLENFHDVRFDLIKSAYGFTNDDYNQTHNISEDTKFHLEDTEKTVNNVIFGAVRNIALRNGITLPKDSDFALEGRKLIQSGKFGKTLIMCRNIEQANQVSSILSKNFDVNVRVSDSKSDVESKELGNFKAGQFDFLCVVNRAREGYDDTSIRNLIDITLTHNIDLIYQMYCRVVRVDKSNSEPKLYLKVTSNGEGMPEYTMNIMTASLMLAATENLKKFNGRNFRNIVMPRVERDIEEEDSDDPTVNAVVEVVVGDNEDGGIRRRQLNELMVMDLIDIFSDDKKKLVIGNDRYAVTTLGSALDIITGNYFDVSSIEECVELANKHGIISADKWGKQGGYKEIEKSEDIKLPSNPWNTFKLEGGGKEFSKLLGGGHSYGISSIDECVKLAKKYGVKSSGQWGNQYREIGDDENIKLPSKPWDVFNLDGREKAFNKLLDNNRYSYDISSIDECVELANKHGIISADKWRKKYKEIQEKEDIKLSSTPWDTFKLEGGSKEFGKLLGNTHGTYDVSTIEECIELAKKFYIVSASQWGKEYGGIDGIKLPSNPWNAFKLDGGSKEFSRLLGYYVPYGVSSIEECVELANKYKIENAGKWTKGGYKEIEKSEDIKLPSNPWNTFNLDGGGPAFSRLLGYYVPYGVSSIEECVELANKYDITSGVEWRKKYKEIGDNENIKLPAEPWNFFKLEGGSKEFSKLLGNNKYSFGVDSIEECIKLGKKHKIKNSGEWRKGGYKQIENKEKIKIPSNPWIIFNLEDGMPAFTKLLNPQKKPTQKQLSEISRINKKGKTTSSKKMNQFFNDNPKEFLNYHKLRKESMDYWEEAPFEEIAKKITEETDKVIDFGCGGNDLKKELPNNQVTPIDHIAIDDSVIACDMSDISKYVEDESHDVAVFSLALWGTTDDKKSYLSEAHRVLKSGGVVHIGDTRGDDDKLDDKKRDLVELLNDSGFGIWGVIDVRDKFIYISAKKIS